MLASYPTGIGSHMADYMNHSRNFFNNHNRSSSMNLIMETIAKNREIIKL
jgi:hypothetical protein